MERLFIKRWIGGSALLLVLIFLISRWNGAPSFGWGVLAGGGWNLLNILLLTSLTRLTFHAGDKSFPLIALAAFLKFPVLYGAGFALLYFGSFSQGGLVTGFSIPLLAVFLQAVAQTGLLGIGGLLRMRKIYG